MELIRKGTGNQTLFSADEIAKAVNGSVVIPAGMEVSSVRIDSRKISAGSLFVPLKGERTDGHDHMEEAVKAGAAGFLCSQKMWGERKTALAGLVGKKAFCVVVNDTLEALQALARHHMAKFPRCVRIGVTGSSGKTTTKELIGAVLKTAANTAVSEGNLNSEIGVPLVAFKVTDIHEYAVFEMGINHPGEMDVLAGIVKPDVAVITNIGTAHMGLLGSREGIAREKKKIADLFDGKQALFIHEDCEFAALLSNGVRGEVIKYGKKSTKGFSGSGNLGLDGTSIDWEGLRIRFPLFGAHNLDNALAALSVAGFLGIDPALVKKSLEAIKPLSGRSEIIKGEISVIKDCYNANPDSMEKALGFFDELAWQGNKIAVLGSMLELGDESDALHRAVGDLVARTGIGTVLFFGEEMRFAHETCQSVMPDGRTGGKSRHFTDMDELVKELKAIVKKGDVILFKGSRGMALERAAESLSP